MTLLQRFRANAVAGVRRLLRPSRIPPDRRAALWPVRGWIGVSALAAILIVVAVSMLLLDVSLVNHARELPDWVHETFGWITWFGVSGWFLWPTTLLLIAIAASRWTKLTPFSQGVLAAISIRISFILLAIGVPALVVGIIKRLIGRGRPYVSDAIDPFSYVPFGWESNYASFPSGHATNAFAVAIAIGALWPSMRIPMWTFAVLIAISRVIVNAHFPSDVIAGALAGTVGALMVRSWFAARHLGFTIGSDGVIHRLPGPSWRRVKEVAGRLLGQ